LARLSRDFAPAIACWQPASADATSVVVPATQAFAIPPQLTDIKPGRAVNYLTASVHRLAKSAQAIQSSSTAPAAGVGIAATQLAKLRQAIVIGRHRRRDRRDSRSASITQSITNGGTSRRVRRPRRTPENVILDPIGGRQF
jgi:NADPH:quinone reductase-like Zn-dependent oxidoreductase